MMLTAILGLLEWETDLARFAQAPIVARLLETLHVDPDNAACLARLGGNSPAVAVVDRDLQAFAERRGKRISIVGCADIVAPPAAPDPLTAGPPVLILGPLDWMGLDDARLRAAIFLAPGWHGADFVVYLHRGANGWTVTRIGPGGAR